MTKNIYVRQLFDAEANTTTAADLEPVITIDHLQRLVDGITSIQTALGIAEMTPMASGTQVKQYKYNKKNDPAQVGEGEVVTPTEYERKLVNTFDLVLEKYRKKTTAEAIQKVGRNKAINDTDDLMILNVQKSIKSKLFKTIAAGTGKATDKVTITNLQSALAALWGSLSDYYLDKNVNAVYFVNPLDIAAYLSNAQITIQTAFGMQYIENFLGLGTVIVDPEVTVNKPQATVKENMNGIYIPAGGDVGQTFGMTADATGLVSMKHFLEDDCVSVDTLILSGVTFYAEDASGVFTATIPTSTGA